MKILCRTNIDICPCEKWPEEMSEVPRVGDYIESGHVWDTEGYKGCVLRLQVCRVTWKYRTKEYGVTLHNPYWYPEVELHLGRQFETMSRFYEWYGAVCGRGKSAFI